MKGSLTSFSYYYGNGTFSIESNGILAGIEIYFSGSPKITLNMPEHWQYKLDRHILLVWTTDENTLNDDIFDYIGTLKVNNVVGIDFKSNKVVGKGFNDYISFWEETDSNYESAGLYESYNKDYRVRS